MWYLLQTVGVSLVLPAYSSEATLLPKGAAKGAVSLRGWHPREDVLKVHNLGDFNGLCLGWFSLPSSFLLSCAREAQPCGGSSCSLVGENERKRNSILFLKKRDRRVRRGRDGRVGSRQGERRGRGRRACARRAGGGPLGREAPVTNCARPGSPPAPLLNLRKACRTHGCSVPVVSMHVCGSVCGSECV